MPISIFFSNALNQGPINKEVALHMLRSRSTIVLYTVLSGKCIRILFVSPRRCTAFPPERILAAGGSILRKRVRFSGVAAVFVEVRV